jgi:hypothetical protein
VVAAYLVISTAAPDRVTRLATALRAGSPGGVIAVHHDDACGSPDLPRLRRLDVDVLDATHAPPGSAAEMMMLIRCMRQLLRSARFDWLVLLSADEYPIRPLTETEASLAATDADAVMERHACPVPEGRRDISVDDPALRYHYRWSRASGPARAAARALATVVGSRPVTITRPDGAWLGVPAKRSPFRSPSRKPLVPPIRRNPLATSRSRIPFGEGLECFYGPRRFALTRDAVAAIDASLTAHPELALYYRDTLDPAESYFHTVLGNDPSIRVRVDDHRRLWSAEPIGPGAVDAVLGSGADFAGPFEDAALEFVDARGRGGSSAGQV